MQPCPAGSAAFYTDRNDFIDNIAAGYFEEEFTGVPEGDAGPLLSFSGNGFSFDVTAVGAGSNNLFNPPNAISTDSALDAIRITFTGAPVHAIGGNFWATDIGFNPTGGEIILTLNDGTAASINPSAITSFGGFISPTAIAFIDVNAPNVPANNWPTMDNVIVGTLGPELTLDPTDLDFGSVPVATTSAPLTVAIENTGAAPLNLGTLALSGAHFGDFALDSDTCSGETLAATETCTFDVTFTPSASGAREAQVDIPSDAPSDPDVLPLAGVGTQAALSVTPNLVNFNEVEVGTTSPATAVTVENTGNVNVNVSNLGISGVDPADFALTNNTCNGALLVPAATCGFDVSMSPTATGARSAQVEIPSDAPTSPEIVPLSGTGTQALLDLDFDTLDFGSLNIGASATLTATITNNGTADLDIDSISTPAAPFSLVGGTCLPTPVTLAPTESCTVMVQFAPVSGGSFNATILIDSNAPSSPDSITLLGSAQSPLPPARSIPVAGPWGLVLLAALMGLIGLLVARKGTGRPAGL
ncbi:MAG TPA: choice-of-anchor D domain-containing protein [Xanthomonadaceae bacterium]|nr:choice-of-anchor D domain-containing protein [Xanthomonadaceae bacterium]